MSDYIAGLRADLVDAAARHQRHGALGRTSLPLRPRAWSRPALAAVFVTAACAAAIVVAVAVIGPPAPTPAKPQRVVTVRLGTEGFDAAYAAGSLWVAGTNGEVVRVVDGRVVDRVKVGQQIESIAAGADSVWAATIVSGAADPQDPLSESSLVRIDARTGAVTRRISMKVHEIGPVAVGAGGVWLVPDAQQGETRLERYDPATGRLAGLVESTYREDLAAGTGVVWALGVGGAIAQIDPTTQSIAAVVPGAHERAAGQDTPGQANLAPDGDGVWVAGGARGDVVRVQAGRIVRRIRVGDGNVFGVARTRDALWVAIGTPTLSVRYRLVRIDPETGRQTGTVELGRVRPAVLTSAGRDLWIVSLGGAATLIR
jgi:hypothetical protein